MMAYQAIAVANEFIHLTKGRSLSPMKLQKLVYYAHGWHLALRNAPLVREDIEAWQFGPVIPELYREFKHYGEANITRPAMQRDVRSSRQYEPRVRSETDGSSDSAFKVIENVWEAYREYSATKLSNATHKPGTPWSQTYVPGCRSMVIPNEIIKAYFSKL